MLSVPDGVGTIRITLCSTALGSAFYMLHYFYNLALSS